MLKGRLLFVPLQNQSVFYRRRSKLSTLAGCTAREKHQSSLASSPSFAKGKLALLSARCANKRIGVLFLFFHCQVNRITLKHKAIAEVDRRNGLGVAAFPHDTLRVQADENSVTSMAPRTPTTLSKKRPTSQLLAICYVGRPVPPTMLRVKESRQVSVGPSVS